MVNDLIIIRLKNVNENKKNKLLTYLKHNSLSYIEINKNTFYEKEKQKQNLEELMRLTLINILNAKGVIYTYYKQQQEREICTLIDTRLFHTAENGTMENKIRKQK